MNSDFFLEDRDEEDVNDKEARFRRIKNRSKDRHPDAREQKIKPIRKQRPRVKVIEYDPDYDEDDYEEYYYD
tara:strand:- start:425 stop:640 length:216 start_codon:yes stop_codon:yes gene_type:complete